LEEQKLTNPFADKYPTARLLEDKVNAYVVHCREIKKKTTMAGLTAWLGYKNKCSLRELSLRDEEYAQIIGNFKLIMEDSTIQDLLTAGKPTAAIIFLLKNNYGYDSDGAWVDRQEVSSKNGGPIIQVISAIDREDSKQDE
jgi:hypothetical protein